MVKMLFAFIGLVFVQNASFAATGTPHYWIGEENGTSYLYRQMDQAQPTKAPIQELDSRRSYFHWTTAETQTRWTGSGMSRDEFNYLRSQSLGQAAGGGLYFSKSPFNSAGFGFNPIAIKVREHAKVVKANSDFFAEMNTVNGRQDASNLIQSLGLDAWEYGSVGTESAWINILRYDALQSFTPMTYESIKNTLPQSFGLFEEELRYALELDRIVDFASHPESLTDFPLIARVMKNELLSSDLTNIRNTLRHQQEDLSRYFYNPIYRHAFEPYQSGGAFSKALRDRFSEIALEILQNDPKFLQNIKDKAYLYRSFSVILPPQALPACSFCGSTRNFHKPLISAELDIPAIKNPFGAAYAESFEFIDLADMLQAQAQDNGAPWTRYDQGTDRMLDRWRTAKARYMYSNIGFFSPNTAAVNELSSTLDRLSELNRIISGNNASNPRRVPLVAGGSHWVNGKNYYRVPMENLETLKSNPYLTLEIVDEPEVLRRTQSVLVRHEYPSARTYQKFQKLLNPSTVKRLQAAELAGKLANDANPEAQELTRLVLDELWEKLPADGNAIKFYRAAISIHPFEDFNGRTLRSLYHLRVGRPLILRNFDWDLLLTEEQLNWEEQQGGLFYSNLRRELSAIEKRNPGFPRFYEAKLPSAYFFDAGDIDKIKKPEFLIESMRFFSNGKVQDSVREKRVLEYGNLNQSDCANILTGPIQ